MPTETEDWTPEAKKAIDFCKGWAEVVAREIPCDVFLFGSAVYEGGDQFDAELSDLDIVVLFREQKGPTDRAIRLRRLYSHKAELELRMIPALERTSCTDPGASILPITSLELQANIHKSGVRRFFDQNFFLDLKDLKISLGIPPFRTATLPDLNRQALEYAQKIRNGYLSVCGNGRPIMQPYDGADPIPKELARVAAQLVPNVRVGEWYDTRLGLEHVFGELGRRRFDTPQLEALYKKISIRRGGRGRRQPLDQFDQLLLAEIVHDLAEVPLDPVVTWGVRCEGPFDLDVIDRLTRLTADGHILGVDAGSVIVRLRTSLRSYETVRMLDDLKVLPQFLGVERVAILDPDEQRDAVSPRGPIHAIIEHIAAWRPRRDENGRESESSLAYWLGDLLRSIPTPPGSRLLREVEIRVGSRVIRADFELRYGAADSDRTLIELALPRSHSQFIHQLERALQFGMPTILVVVGSPEELESYRPDIDRLGQVSTQVRAVLVPYGDASPSSSSVASRG